MPNGRSEEETPCPNRSPARSAPSSPSCALPPFRRGAARGAYRLCRLRRHHDRRQHRGPAEDAARRRCRRRRATPASTLWDRACPAPEAAWINGAAAHALDYDDVALRGHPSAVLVPAILAEGSRCKASGAQMATAYVAGYEVWADLQRRDPRPAPREGLASHRHLRRHRRRRGLRLPARPRPREGDAGDRARRLAERGPGVELRHHDQAVPRREVRARRHHRGAPRRCRLHASPDALEHPLGFLAAVSPKGNVDRTSPTQAGRDWNILTQGLSVKKYPLCYCTHRAIDGALDLLPTRRSAPPTSRRSPSRPAGATPRCCATAGRRPGSRPSSACSSPWRARSRPAASASPSSPTTFVQRQGRAGADPQGRGGARRSRGPAAAGCGALRSGGDRDHGRPPARKRARHAGARLAASCRCRPRSCGSSSRPALPSAIPSSTPAPIFDALMSIERQPGVSAFTSLRKAA